MKIAFVHNFCTHYTRPVFESLSKLVPIEYYFFSEGQEWYWQQECAASSGDFKHEYLRGFRLGRTRITPSLISRLLGTDYDAYIKCINGRFALPLTFVIAKLRGKPFILRTGIWMRIETRFHRMFFPVTRYIYRHSDAFVVYGEHTKRYLASEGVDTRKVFVAPHAVENQRYGRPVSEDEKTVLRQTLGLTRDQKMILFMGRLEEVKGLRYLIEAFAKVQDETAVLVIVGSGSEREQLEFHVRERGLEDRVHFAGHVSPSQTVVYYASAYCMVLPSVTTGNSKELWGLVVNEAMNQGVPVIATTAVGAAAGGLVVDGVNGCVVPERHAGAIATSLDLLLSDRALRDKYSRAALQTIANWTPQRMAEAFRDAVYFALKKQLPSSETLSAARDVTPAVRAESQS